MTDNTQSDVVEALSKASSPAEAWHLVINNRAALASLSTKDSDVMEEAAEIGALLRFARGRCDAGSPAVKAINKALDLLGRTALTSSDAVLEEQAAKRIYEHWSFGTWFKGDKPAWVEGGNSEAQVLARTFAHAAIRKGGNA